MYSWTVFLFTTLVIINMFQGPVSVSASGMDGCDGATGTQGSAGILVLSLLVTLVLHLIRPGVVG